MRKMMIAEIFQKILPDGHSLSEARRQLTMVGVRFNGEQVAYMGLEVEVAEGSTFQVGKKAGNSWRYESGKWVRLPEGIHNEGSLRLGQYYLVFPKFPADCDYVRVVNYESGTEIAYWDQNEWAEAPAKVMGAIIGAMCEGVRGTRR